ncbi:hypothetical protein Dda_8939 [Drechslerella dactyloides]|uniref:Uncharacterized protein n=1 Tax=Drechslerella dactyloides TaxID=74499 RepID=A0AAD6IQB9_DREDA|nr:hypothetical protein Dda_8939 [Drechslerella dactyloides]
MATKLPLITRKNIRDEYTAKIGDLTAKVKQYTGVDHEFTVDFNTLFPMVKQDDRYQTESPGSIAYTTYEGFVDKLGRVTEEGDDETAKEFFNKVVSTRKIDIVITEECPSSSGCRVKDGVFEILYKPGSYGTNSSYATDDLEKELDKAFAATNKGELPLIAKKGFQVDFVAKKADLEKQISEELLDNTVTLVVDPEAIWRLANEEYDKLKRNEKSDIDLESISRNMGSAAYGYFDGFLGMLRYKFKQDDMMVEAFLEACPKKEIHFKLVRKDELSRSYNDSKFEDDVLVIRACPQTWYTNCSDATDEVEKLL